MLIDQLEEKAHEFGVNMLAVCQLENGIYTTKQLQEANEKNNVYSVSKSITSLIVGILADRKVIDLYSASVSDIFSSAGYAMPDGWKKVMPVHLLTHTTGYGEGCLDIDQDDIAEWGERDYLEVAFEQPLIYQPGEKMVYSDANYYLLSRVISQKTGRTLQDLVREWLFNPLGITGAAWAVCPQGYAMGATGLFLSVFDMAKIGELLLNGGRWKGCQLIPEWWIREMTQKRTAPDPSEQDGYGYGYWVRGDTDAFMANGMLGQLIFISPGKRRVVAWQSCTHSEKIGELTEMLVQWDKKY